MMLMFEFNGSYNDLAQVAEWIGEFARIRQESTDRTGRSFVYNDDLIDSIPGIANKAKRGPSSGTHEDTAIYLLQGLYRAWEMEAKILDLLEAGYEPIDRVDGVERFQHVVLYPSRSMGGEWAEYESARLVPEDTGPHNGWIKAVLPKGKRSLGHLVMGRKVLVLR